MNLKLRTDEIHVKLTETERVSRQKDEALFGLSKEIEKLQNILNNYELTDKKLKNEIIILVQAKNESERQLQEFKNKNVNLDSTYKQLNEEVLALQRENRFVFFLNNKLFLT
jgi:chromosome segregation ATPase